MSRSPAVRGLGAGVLSGDRAPRLRGISAASGAETGGLRYGGVTSRDGAVGLILELHSRRRHRERNRRIAVRLGSEMSEMAPGDGDGPSPTAAAAARKWRRNPYFLRCPRQMRPRRDWAVAPKPAVVESRAELRCAVIPAHPRALVEPASPTASVPTGGWTGPIGARAAHGSGGSLPGDAAPAARKLALAPVEGRAGVWERLVIADDLESERAEIDTRRGRP
jgi:hypothetical protein